MIDKCSFVFISESGLFDLRVMSQILAKQLSLSVKQQAEFGTNYNSQLLQVSHIKAWATLRRF